MLAPAAGLGTLLRGSRLFHPRGDVFDAAVVEAAGRYLDVGQKLAGRALVRLSAGLRRSDGRFDLLGLAIRFTGPPGDRDEARVPQDLLFLTTPSIAALPFALFRTRTDDFLANDYYALGTFLVEGVGAASLRARWLHRSADAQTRSSRLMRSVEQGRAILDVELRPSQGPWQPVVSLRLERAAEHGDSNGLGFSPFHAGLGLHPRGFVHSLRVGPYAVGQAIRRRLRGTSATASERTRAA